MKLYFPPNVSLRLKQLIFASITTILISINIGYAQVSEQNDVEQIKSKRIEFNMAIKNYDLDAITQFFDNDYIISYGSGSKVLSLKDEIASWQDLFSSMKGAYYVRTPIEVIISNNLPLAYEHGNWVGTEDGDETFSGRYTAAWRKTDGVWKLHNELFVTLGCEGAGC